jgi:predicted O-methyltransferase YrrM
MADLISDSLQAYLDSYSDEEPEYLRAIRSQTEQEVHSPHMLSGHYQGRLLAMISKLISPVNILEIGTYTGYSALCLAEGLPDHGKLITIEKDATLEQRILKNFSLDPIGQKIQLLTGDAHQILQTLDFQPDLVFVDADKQQYSEYLHCCLTILKPGGVLLFDNTLWSGRVLNSEDCLHDPDTRHMHNFNQMVAETPGIEVVMLPLRDGLTMIRKTQS